MLNLDLDFFHIAIIYIYSFTITLFIGNFFWKCYTSIQYLFPKLQNVYLPDIVKSILSYENLLIFIFLMKKPWEYGFRQYPRESETLLLMVFTVLWNCRKTYFVRTKYNLLYKHWKKSNNYKTSWTSSGLREDRIQIYTIIFRLWTM